MCVYSVRMPNIRTSESNSISLLNAVSYKQEFSSNLSLNQRIHAQLLKEFIYLAQCFVVKR